jgi:anti-sigma B factor antagonist
MKLTANRRGDTTVLEVSGELTCDSAPRFAEAVARAFAEGGRDFVVDLRHTGSVDSVGLEALTALQRQCEEQLGMACFCSPDSTLRKILELTRLNRSLTLHDTVDEGLASLHGTRPGVGGKGNG